MAEQPVSVMAKFSAKKGQEAALRSALTACIAPSRKDPGCVSYNLFASVERPEEFMMIEVWASQERLAKHLETPHLQALVSQTADMLAEPMSVRLYSELSGN